MNVRGIREYLFNSRRIHVFTGERQLSMCINVDFGRKLTFCILFVFVFSPAYRKYTLIVYNRTFIVRGIKYEWLTINS